MMKNFKLNVNNRTIDASAFLPECSAPYPLIIMSHGFLGSRDDSYQCAPFFAEHGIGAVCFNFCGGGPKDESGVSSTEMTLYTEKEELEAVLSEVSTWESVDREQIYLLGTSQGGMISALVAEDHMDKIKGLILQYPALCIADDWNKNFPEIKDIPETYDLWGWLLGKNYFLSIRDLDIFKTIGKFDKKVFILHGADDDVVPVSYSQKASELYQNAQLVIFPKEGHGFSPETDLKAQKLILDFIQE